MDIVYHYPPDLFQLLVQTIPRLCPSKRDVMLFFRGAGVDSGILQDLWDQVESNPDSIHKYDIARTVLQRLNERGESTLRERREILKRVTEFEDFSSCWANDRLKAKGLVAEVRDLVNVKDSFTRMKLEREKESRHRAREYESKMAEMRARKTALMEVRQDLYSLFSHKGPVEKRKRGLQLEKILNRLFEIYGVLVRESFCLREPVHGKTIQQIDGAIEFDGEIYLVEMKWLDQPAAPLDVTQHLSRLYHRGSARGLFVSASSYSVAAIAACKAALAQKVVVLCTLEELVKLIEREGDFGEFLREKVRAAIIDTNPFKPL